MYSCRAVVVAWYGLYRARLMPHPATKPPFPVQHVGMFVPTIETVKGIGATRPAIIAYLQSPIIPIVPRVMAVIALAMREILLKLENAMEVVHTTLHVLSRMVSQKVNINTLEFLKRFKLT